MPSVWEETAGLAAIEQMMRGRLVIASKIGGLAEVVDEAGLTFPAGDAQALADCMLTVLQGPSIIESVGRTARDRALRFFRRERMIEDHAHVYREVRATTKC
jgi:glycosyltransferase involved in cell wall biosynthesis